MRGPFLFVLAIFLLGIQLVGNGQNIEVSGKIIDKETKEPIPFANIALKDLYKGTACNALGEFSFKIDSLPVVLAITHLSYEPIEIELTDNDPLLIELVPGKLLMDELVIKAKGNDEYAYNLIEKAYYKIQSGRYREHYGKAFYRQISRNGDEYSELYEIFYDTKYSNNGVEDWAIQEGRYALKLSTADSFIYNKNFTLMVRLLTIVQPRTDDLIVPVSENVREQFYLITDQILSVNNRKVAQIRFEKNESVSYPAMEGEIWIDTESYEVLKLIGRIDNDNLNFISLKGKTGSWKNYEVTCEIAFKPLDNDELALDYIRLGQNFDYYVDGVFANKVETRSFFNYYEYYTPPKRKKLGGRLLRFRDRDSDLLDNIGYNQQFWDDNIIVKRTPVEAEVIRDFEEERAFGSIYLNNRDQIVLDDKQLDSDEYIIFVKKQLSELELPRKGEKVYLHLDKPMYVAGERMWFKPYIVNMATNEPTGEDGALQVELYAPGGDYIMGRSYQIRKGKCDGYFDLPDDLASGLYRLRSFTNRMRVADPHYYFSTDLQILTATQESDEMARSVKDSTNTIRFYAEGGRLIDKMPAQIGYHASDRFGNPLDVKGKLLNGEGRLVANIKSEYDGFGSMFILPQSEAGLDVMIMSDDVRSAPFPEINSQGYSMMVNNLKPNTIDITIRGSVKLEGQKIYILVISNGVLFDRRIGMLTRGLYKCEIPKSNLPNSITQLLLVDESGNVRCKRLVFPNQPEYINARYFLAKNEYRKRDRIDVVIDLRDENGKPVRDATFSVSVLDSDKLSRQANLRNIRSYLGLEYTLDFKVRNPGLMFEDFDRESLKQLDWLMLCQQTISPDFSKLDNQQGPAEEDPQLPETLSLQGIATNSRSGKPLANGYLSIVKKGDPAGFSRYVETDEHGQFTLEGIRFSGQIEAMALARTSSGNMVNVDVMFISGQPAQHSFKTELVEIPNQAKKYAAQFRKDQEESSSIPQTADVPQVENSTDTPDQFGAPAYVYSIDPRRERNTNLFEIMGDNFQGVTIVEDNREAKVVFADTNQEPAILLDGFILYAPDVGSESSSGLQAFALNTEDVKDVLQRLTSSAISKIELYKPAEQSQLTNTPFSSGIIALYSSPGEILFSKKVSAAMSPTVISGFAGEGKFYSPQYTRGSDDSNENLVLDLRTTLFWDPEVTINRKGRAKIGFYNSDDARNFQICIEGITSDGIPIFDLYEFGRNVNRGQVN